MKSQLTRRGFALMGAAAGATLVSAPRVFAQRSAAPTAAEVVVRIKQRLKEEGVVWRDQVSDTPTVDSFKAGDHNTRVTGILTTFMSTWEIMAKAKAIGANLVVTHEPTFYSHEEDARVYDNLDHEFVLKKKQFIEDNGLVVWRIHDHWHARRPEPMNAAFANRIGWGMYAQPDGRTFIVPPITLGDLAEQVRQRLETRNVRVSGDPSMLVTRVGRGGHFAAQNLNALRTLDVLIVSEAREYDSIEYVRDCNELGVKKGFLHIAHEQGEEYGMQLAQPWLASIVPEVPVTYVPTGEPFWAL